MLHRVAPLLLALFCTAVPAPPAAGQSMELALKIARFALDLRDVTSAEDAARSSAARLDSRLAELVEAQIAEEDLSDLIDARLDAFALRETQRALAGAALRLRACTTDAACAQDLTALDAQLRRMSAEIAAQSLSAATVALLERARSIHMGVLAAQEAPLPDRAALAARYGRYFEALAVPDPQAPAGEARAELIAALAARTALAPEDLDLPRTADPDRLIDLYLATAGDALVLRGLRAHFDGGVRFLDTQSVPGMKIVYYNCRLNRERLGLFEGRVAPFLHYAPLREVVENEGAFRAAPPPAPGVLHSLLWQGVSLRRTAEGLTAEARQYGLYDDGEDALALPYAGEFYRNGALWEEAAIPLLGARTDGELLSRLGVYPWTVQGPCRLTDGLVLTDTEAGFAALERVVETEAAAAVRLLRALAALERVRLLAADLAAT